MTAEEVTDYLCCYYYSPFNNYRWLVVPNVSHGWHLPYEADLIAVSKAGWAQEIEIKVSASDLKADKKKAKHGNGPWPTKIDERIQRFWYAVPENLIAVAMDTTHVPAFAGVIAVKKDDFGHLHAVKIREAVKREGSRKVTDKERIRLMELGMARYWSQRERAKP